MVTARIPICLAALIFAVHPNGAGAADGTRLAKAQTYLDLATKLYRAGDYRGALAELRRAEPLAAHEPVLPMIRFNIARCHEKLGEDADAVEAYEHYLEVGEDSSRQARARQMVEQLAPIAFGRVDVTCGPDGAAVEIAMLTEGAVPCPLALDRVRPGTYPVEFTREDHMPAMRTLVVERGATAALVVALEPLAAPLAVEGVETPPPVSRYGPWPERSLWSGVGFGVVGGIFHGLTALERDRLERERDLDWMRFHVLEGAAYTGYAVGGALIATALVLWALDGEAEPAPGGLALRW